MFRDGPLRRRPPEEIRYGVGKCRLGALLVASSVKGVVSIVVRDEGVKLEPELRRRFPKAELVRDDRGERVGEHVVHQPIAGGSAAGAETAAAEKLARALRLDGAAGGDLAGRDRDGFWSFGVAGPQGASRFELDPPGGAADSGPDAGSGDATAATDTKSGPDSAAAA